MLIPWRQPKPEPPAVHRPFEDMSVDELERMHRTLTIANSLMDLGDLAAASFAAGDVETAHKALRDYHALRNEHVKEPFRL